MNTPDQEPDQEIVKHREIRFQAPHSDPDQARSAVFLLGDADGIISLEAADPLVLRLSYDVRYITLQDIEGALEGVGFHLDNSLMSKLRRTVWHYADETQRDNMGCRNDSNCTARIFVNRYQRTTHGCRDDRPSHWRRYL
ncbi:MAG: hypothetical protein U5S82_06670 [Gammaproteobacteria bacterium]|nr:hypothetical protein [Gammaproteobacteria bacterium]